MYFALLCFIITWLCPQFIAYVLLCSNLSQVIPSLSNQMCTVILCLVLHYTGRGRDAKFMEFANLPSLNGWIYVACLIWKFLQPWPLPKSCNLLKLGHIVLSAKKENVFCDISLIFFQIWGKYIFSTTPLTLDMKVSGLS